MLLRTAVLLCLPLFAAPCLAQTSQQSPAKPPTTALKLFRDPGLNMTFAYPAEFTPVMTGAAKAQASDKGPAAPQCVRSILSAGSESKLGSSAFVISAIDGTCPGALKQAEQQGWFTKEQILRQLKRYGTASLLQEPFHYTIDGRPAAITLGSARQDDTAVIGVPVVTTYAAKACFRSIVPDKQKAGAKAQADEVICLDFTTQHRDLLTGILEFSVQFDDGMPHPIVTGNALH
ncbi:hypothetical protein [Edaphobacter bradus]|uniref:hypothetical protein n=1 Tax=Edaphobacter bradus TaxID=2259016 RepID=UPI0021DFA791|nr:hypothetical protein [Edaphobacter bradus]